MPTAVTGVDSLAPHRSVARIPEHHSLIGGEFGAADGDAFDVVAPAFGAPLASIRAATAADVDSAVAAASAAQGAWAAGGASARTETLLVAAASIASDADRLATLITLDNGKTRREAAADVTACVALVQSAAGWATRLKGSTLPPDGDLVRMSWREPLGVVGVIMPFNAPLMFSAMKIAPALAMGNAVVAKSPEKSPLAPVAFVDHLVDAGVPAGVINLVHGFGATGHRLVEHPDVRMISFTGSNVVGAAVGATAAGHAKRVVLELGGKSANIVYDDAPLEEAVAGSLGGIFGNAGQRCFSGSRLLLHDGIADEFLARFVAGAAGRRVGDPFAAETEMGSLITAADVERVDALVGTALDEGAALLCGANRPSGVPDGGAYYTPTVLDATGVSRLGLLRQEVFGPVVTVQRFAEVADAITMANDSEFGLAGGCWTASLDRALATARAVDTGMFWVNSYATPGGAEATLEARRGSGFGAEKGEDGALQYTTQKSLVLRQGATR